MLLNAKSGACQEDCHYCSQSSISTASIDRYAMISPTEMMEGSPTGCRRESPTVLYCHERPITLLIGRVQEVSTAVQRIKEEDANSESAVLLGLLTQDQAETAQGGRGRPN